MIYNILQKDTKINQLNNTISQTNKTVSLVNSSLSSTNNSVSSINSTLSSHRSASNPHGITKATIGLGDVDNTKDADKNVSVAKSINDGTCTFTPTQIRDRFKRCLFLAGLYEQKITLVAGGEFFQALPSQYQKDAYIYMINCSGNSCKFIANMEKYHMAVKNISSETLTTTVQVYIFAENIY